MHIASWTDEAICIGLRRLLRKSMQLDAFLHDYKLDRNEDFSREMGCASALHCVA